MEAVSEITKHESRVDARRDGERSLEQIRASIERRIGQLRSAEHGPTLIVVGSIHGNELAGTLAARRVFAKLRDEGITLRGELVGLTANVEAARIGRRYQLRDLNRVWSNEAVEAMRVRAPELDDAEDREQRELLQEIEAAIGRARGPVHVIDLHTTSAAGYPFVLFGDTLPQRMFASDLPLPVILGLEEQIDGVLSSYLTSRGCTTFAVEGGQHDDPASIDALEAVIWIALTSARLVSRDANPHFASSVAQLDAARGSIPRVLEVLHRHAITPRDEFRMAPGFANLAAAHHGQLLANDVSGAVIAPDEGYVILPLYQGQGEDGFFWGRAVSDRHLWVSAMARRARLDRWLGLVPGVVRAAGDDQELTLVEGAARHLPPSMLRFFGYRKLRRDGEALVARRARS